MKKMMFAIGTMVLGLVSLSVSAQAQQVQQCREFTRDIVIDGETVQGVGKACLQLDGSWRIVSSEGVGREVVFVEPREEEVVIVKPRKKFVRYPSASFGYRKGFGHHGGFHGRSKFHHSKFNRGYYGHKKYKSFGHKKHGFHGKKFHGKKYSHKGHHGGFKKHH